MLERAHRFLGTQVAQEADDQPVADAELALAVGECAADAVECSLERDAPCRVRLRIEEDLDVHDAVGMRTAQIGHRQCVEIVLVAQHVGPGIVEVEEGLQVAEVIRPRQAAGPRVEVERLLDDLERARRAKATAS